MKVRLGAQQRTAEHGHRGQRAPRARRVAGVATPPGDAPCNGRTPTATDYRFGFEITLYIANR